MKLVIFGDTHLGRRNFKVKEREQDFENSFKQVIDSAINEKADAVIHTGDLFDIGAPRIETIIFAVKQLSRLKREGIPFCVIAGSHDISVEGSFLKVLDELGLAVNVSDKRYYESREDSIVLKGELVKGLFVSGLYAKRSDINEVLQFLKPEFPDKAFKVFIFHHFIEDINPLFGNLKKSSLPKGFDLYVSGHWHEFFTSEFNGKKILYPGSTESCDLRDMHNKKKGFIIYDTLSNEYEFKELMIRESRILEVDCNNLSSDDVVDKLIGLIKPGGGGMLFFILKGRLSSGFKSSINRELIYDSAKKNNYLLCRVYTGSLENPEEVHTEVSQKTISEIEKEYFKNKGFNDKEVFLAQELIKQLGVDYKNSELDERVEEVVNWLYGELL